MSPTTRSGCAPCLPVRVTHRLGVGNGGAGFGRTFVIATTRSQKGQRDERDGALNKFSFHCKPDCWDEMY